MYLAWWYWQVRAVANLATAGGEEVGVAQVESGGDVIDWVGGPGGGGKRFPTKRKKPSTLRTAFFVYRNLGHGCGRGHHSR